MSYGSPNHNSYGNHSTSDRLPFHAKCKSYSRKDNQTYINKIQKM